MKIYPTRVRHSSTGEVFQIMKIHTTSNKTYSFTTYTMFNTRTGKIKQTNDMNEYVVLLDRV